MAKCSIPLSANADFRSIAEGGIMHTMATAGGHFVVSLLFRHTFQNRRSFRELRDEAIEPERQMGTPF